MFPIGYRTIKTAVGAGLSLSIAQWLGLQFSISAAILTVLCIKPTKMASLASAWQRFVACLVGMGMAAVFFHFFGRHPISIVLLLLVFIPTVVRLKATEGVITSTVILFHVYVTESPAFSFFLNELLVITIGIGVALLLNMYMPSLEKPLARYREKIDCHIAVILREFAVYLKEGDSEWDGKEIIETEQLLQEAKRLALKDVENHLLREEDSYYTYFRMREKQFEILQRLMPAITSFNRTYTQGKTIGDFLERLSEKVAPKNTAERFLHELSKMREQFRQSPLPQTREEFEARSALLHFLNEMEIYLQLKRDLKDRAARLVDRSQK